ncbi:hypothetical protein MKX03_008177 [Papaver bracteatum]|nr:hypothetical protein MKX03_008177 [Papaver bracteatum]
MKGIVLGGANSTKETSFYVKDMICLRRILCRRNDKILTWSGKIQFDWTLARIGWWTGLCGAQDGFSVKKVDEETSSRCSIMVTKDEQIMLFLRYSIDNSILWTYI